MKRIAALLLALLLTLLLPYPAARADSPKLIALTFDDGPGPYTQQLLEILDENDAKATFFLIGSNVERYPETTQMLYEQGHQLGNHTYCHEVLTGRGEADAAEQIEMTAELLDKACGEGTGYALRPPCGEYRQELLEKLKCPAVLWSVDTMDWRDKNAELVAERIVDGAFDGAIILCHDIYETTVEAVGIALKKLREQGYEPVTVNELFRRRGVALRDSGNYGKCRPTGTELPPIQPPELTKGENGITLTSPQDAPIRYTLDGSIPKADAPVYDEPIRLDPGQTLCAVCAFDLNGSRSEPVYLEGSSSRNRSSTGQ